MLEKLKEKIKEYNKKNLERRKKEAREKPVMWQIWMIIYALSQVAFACVIVIFAKDVFAAVFLVFLITFVVIVGEHDMYKIYKEAHNE